MRQPPHVFRSPTITHFHRPQRPTFSYRLTVSADRSGIAELTMRQFWQNSKLSQVLNNPGDGLGVQGVEYRLSSVARAYDLGTPKVGKIARG